MINPICFALDFPTLGRAANFVIGGVDDSHEPIRDLIGSVKIGLELFIASGPRSVEVFAKELGLPVVLDLKLHDIPETVARAIKAGGDLGVKFMTLHIQQRKTLEMAVKAAEPYGIKLLGVTVLTSMSPEDLEDLYLHVMPDHDLEGRQKGVTARVEYLAAFGYGHGLKGFVCSPKEVGLLKKGHADGLLKKGLDDAFFLVPGVRPAGSDTNDQQRTGTPAQAVADGANAIVIGRPIREAQDPAQACRDILASLGS